MLGVGERVELDACVGVGQAEALEGGEDVAAGGSGGAAFGQQSGELLVGAERGAGLGFDQPEDQQRDPDDADQRVDAVVVVQEDRADLEGLLDVAVAALDDLLVFVEPEDLAGGDPAGEVRRERVDPVEGRGCVDRGLVALPGDCQLVVRVVTVTSIRPVMLTPRICPIRRCTCSRVL